MSDAYPLGRMYRLSRVVEGLSLYHLGKVKEAYGVLRLGSDRPPRDVSRRGERSIARSAALATAFAAFQLKDFASAKTVLESWLFRSSSGKQAGNKKPTPKRRFGMGRRPSRGGTSKRLLWLSPLSPRRRKSGTRRGRASLGFITAKRSGKGLPRPSTKFSASAPTVR